MAQGAYWIRSTWMFAGAKFWSCSAEAVPGKTTLLKHVLGLAKPEAGSITINGVDITSLLAIRARRGSPANRCCFSGRGAFQFDVR